MLEKEYEYYLNNKESLFREYRNKFIVIKEDSIIGIYSTREESLKETIKNHKLGTFLIQEISDPNLLIKRFYSRVYV